MNQSVISFNFYLDIFNKIPIDIIRENILPFTYNTQPISLCQDIKSFFVYKKFLMQLYYDNSINKDEYLEWLSNDISRFMNDDIPCMIEYTDSYIYRYSLLYKNRNKSRYQVLRFIYNIELESPIERCINTQLCVLNHNERILLLEFIYKMIFPLQHGGNFSVLTQT